MDTHFTSFQAENAANLRAIFRHLTTEITDRPRLFTLDPVERSRWNPQKFWNKKYQLILWCKHPGEEHPCNPDTLPNLTLHQPKEWFEKATPHLDFLTNTLRITAITSTDTTTLLPETPTPNQAALEQMKANIELIGNITTAIDLPHTPNATIYSAGLRQFRELLFEIDKPKHFPGLTHITTHAGNIPWISPDHYPEYDPDLPHITQHSPRLNPTRTPADPTNPGPICFRKWDQDCKKGGG